MTKTNAKSLPHSPLDYFEKRLPVGRHSLCMISRNSHWTAPQPFPCPGKLAAGDNDKDKDNAKGKDK